MNQNNIDKKTSDHHSFFGDEKRHSMIDLMYRIIEALGKNEPPSPQLLLEIESLKRELGDDEVNP